jgi:FtsP/CotA-like multicopper oxidase with cupredoxin domain
VRSRTDILADPRRRAALALLAAALVSGSIVVVGMQAFGPRTAFYAFAALIQLVLALALYRSARRLHALVAVAVGASVALTLLWRTVGVPASVPGLRLLDATDAPPAAAALQILGLVVLLVGRRYGPGVLGVAAATRLLVGTLLAVVLTGVGVLSAASEVPSARMSSGHGTLLTDLREPPGSEPLREFTLVAEPREIGGETYWTYNGTVPGPEVRVAEGDRLRVTLVNRLPEATSIHWHGVSVPNAEDGVAGLTQNAVPPGGSYTYEFVVREPGTFWFHPHQDTFHQTLRGLFAALVVVPRGGLSLDRDHTLFVHEFYSGTRDEREVLGGLITGVPSGQAPTFNGTVGDLRLDARPGECVRLRVIGALQGDKEVRDIPEMMRARPQELVLVGAPFAVVALDGRDLNAPALMGPTRLPLAIGQRYDLEFTMPLQGAVRLVDRYGGESVTIGDGAAPGLTDISSLPQFDLLAYGAPAPDPTVGGRFDRTYGMALERHFGFHEGALQLVHTIEGKASPHGANYAVGRGERVRFVIDYRTDEIHSMHLHGHSFAVRGSPVRLDSLLVGPRERWEVAFEADNPGLWMFHCHVLIHAAFGMVATVSYPGIDSPFDMGMRSGNRPE